MKNISKPSFLLMVVLVLVVIGGRAALWAQGAGAGNLPTVVQSSPTAVAGTGKAAAAAAPKTEEHEPFDPHYGTWLNGISRSIWRVHEPPVFDKETGHVENRNSVLYDSLMLAILVMAFVAAVGVSAARKAKIRPDNKVNSLANVVEYLVEQYREYLVGVMGNDLTIKYGPLISSYFFVILFMNWLGLIPGLASPTANPNVPISMAIVGFFCVHIIAIREAGLKSWLLHFVGEPLWLAPLNLPLHMIGELVKPVSLSLRLLCNVFGEETVISVLTALAIAVLPAWLPIPFQLPMLFLGSFFGFLQALVFSTLLAIYISIFATHHDDHDSHNIHGHVEHVETFGHKNTVAHPSETPVA